MGRNKKQNPFAARKRQKRENGPERPDRRALPYEEIKRDNAFFIKYYHLQKICASEEEWSQFLESIRDNLPTTFRVTGFKDEAKALLSIIETQLFTEYVRAVAELHQKAPEDVERPLCLPWYPNGLAYQLHLTRKDIRRSEPLYRLHNFLIVETTAGGISRQEAVSMIPPIVMDVRPTDKVLDMCAAPGSKTAQLIEALHAAPEEHKIPPGFVLANDVDNNRCYMLVHQAKRLNSPCLLVTNHDSSVFPNLLTTMPDGSKAILKFDKILCDVPCSGDGTLRKNPDIWLKWNLAQAYNLHGIQYRIVRRGAEMLEVGGRLVYSTCSLNPIENEAVLQRIIKDADGALELVDAGHLVPGLKYKPGMTDWKLATKEVDQIFTNFDEVPESLHTIIRPGMFPLPADEMAKIGLDKCLRVLPHLQDSGGFFVAVLEKRRQLSFEKNDVVELVQLNEKAKQPAAEPQLDEEGKPVEEKSVPWGPQRKKRRLHGYKEDPYVFFGENDPDYEAIKEFYQLNESLSQRCLLTRCITEKKKNIYYCSDPIRDLVLNNENNIKIINTGVKTFVRCENRHTVHPFRLAQEGLQTSNAFMGANRRIQVEREDLVMMLNCTDPTQPPSTHELKKETQERCKELGVGSCILKYVDERFTLYTVGWRGTSSLRAYVHKDETIHILRLLGSDLSKFETNKYEDARVAAAAAADAEAGKSGEAEAGSSGEGAATESTSISGAVDVPEAAKTTSTPMDTEEVTTRS
ncbi:tRNA (cytosine(34)-C(5))-methyltransferase [Drosophila yakuba]|uniref:tRNA (cytosine(34)-C(5))-methyltransferase n=2 Tax=Drosophila yakuba TaxID=7245 RepID=B4Q0F3_DROYA|nr:tRNA (cytosine(34)-C(5))-methyltransferase [Drosophila yakuba]EDX01237.1 EG:EG0007.9 [Drosophila yakuba]